MVIFTSTNSTSPPTSPCSIVPRLRRLSVASTSTAATNSTTSSSGSGSNRLERNPKKIKRSKSGTSAKIVSFQVDSLNSRDRVHCQLHVYDCDYTSDEIAELWWTKAEHRAIVTKVAQQKASFTQSTRHNDTLLALLDIWQKCNAAPGSQTLDPQGLTRLQKSNIRGLENDLLPLIQMQRLHHTQVVLQAAQNGYSRKELAATSKAHSKVARRFAYAQGVSDAAHVVHQDNKST